ncbi:hypothetical protein AGABI1DRAFT_104959 [Agaricus bisporus var. burnettii JB137-S8]|uniref:DUF6593 domain-containing protein n=1 Tax=Agaricus bisporus var. burnettii (strain JB137-S8 / ATCC MYA-4627 / FGSC 10392) TaxID=597362 RepID=K5XIV6_AGABU|nr:uncharacterized protein AGABI1DRAFT_104959 [Agaricus bisporus var. burnettii JB137-S8]EKM83257.1 hypothetical protein AGABI1DRAFT_104959 [Agaricus bisporus var. burnettii JB137-S8]
MRLILSSSRHPRNSAYSTETGQMLYKVDKPHKFGSSIATIRKAVKTIDGVWQGDLDSKYAGESFLVDNGEMIAGEQNELEKKSGERRSMDSQDAPFADTDSEKDNLLGRSTNGLPVLEGNFAFHAQVEFHTFNSTHFRYNNLDIPVNRYFCKEGWSWYGRGRVFKASDGTDYRWNLCAKYLEMVKNDGTKKQLVRFREHRPSLGPFMKGRPAVLEVDDSCVPILDEIMMTFIYCQKLRKDRQKNERRSA